MGSLLQKKRVSGLTGQLVRYGTSSQPIFESRFMLMGERLFVWLRLALEKCSKSEYRRERMIESGYYADPTRRWRNELP